MKKEKTIEIYILVKPWDYTTADVEVFTTKEEVENEIKNMKSDGEKTFYWSIIKKKISVST